MASKNRIISMAADNTPNADPALRRLLSALEADGREVTRVETLTVSGRKLDAYTRARDSDRGNNRSAQRFAYHTTSCAAARSIAENGFDPSRARSVAFGRGVNLGTSTEQALLYASAAGTTCTLVCAVAVGRSHANRSMVREGDAGGDTVPLHMHPRPGFDSMHGARGRILVVPDPARVLPLVAVSHRARRAERKPRKN
jgi:hypothetical protein